MKNLKLRDLMVIALLIAIEIVLARFVSVNTPIVRIGFGFVPLTVCAMLYGTVPAMICCGAADFLGATLFPYGAYFPGYTLSSALIGAVWGLFLHKKNAGAKEAFIAASINNIIIGLFISSFWVSLTSGSPYLAVIPTRIVRNVIMIPIEVVIISLIRKPVMRMAKKELGI